MSSRWPGMFWKFGALLGAVIFFALVWGLGFHRRPHFIHNFEADEYGRDRPFIEPTTVVDGLAVYVVGSGDPVLLFPYPHGQTTAPMVQSDIAESIISLGRSVVTFDVPGAYRSTRTPVGDMDEMVASADEALDHAGISGPVDVVGHSMGGLAALAYAVERPDRVRRLVLVTGLSGFPAAARWGFPGSAFRFYEADYWRIIFWGMRLNSGRGDLALYKKLQNLMSYASYYDKLLFTPIVIEPDDREQGVPIRTIWSKNMYSRLSYASRLGVVEAETLIIAGRHDPEAPMQCSEELLRGIKGAELIVFEHSGHQPFVEEPGRFEYILDSFLNRRVSR